MKRNTVATRNQMGAQLARMQSAQARLYPGKAKTKLPPPPEPPNRSTRR